MENKSQTRTFPALREFLDQAAQAMRDGDVTRAALDTFLDQILLGIGLDENERAWAAKLEELGAESAPSKVANDTDDFRRGFVAGYEHGARDGAAAEKKRRNAAKRARKARSN